MPDTGFQDRSLRLTLFGVVAILAGLACGLFSGLQFLLAAAAGRVSILDSFAADPRGYLMGALIYGALAAAFVAVGTGSMRRRRWVRSMALTLGWTWLIAGALSLVFAPAVVDGAFEAAMQTGQVVPGEALNILKWFLIAGVALAGVVTPALFVWVYRDPDLQATCERHDPVSSWTERCPTSVLGLSVGLVAGGVLSLPMALRPAVPMFGTMITGWPGVLLMLLFAAASLYLARSTYRLEIRGWWLATAGLSLLGVTTAITFWRLDPLEIYRAMGYPPEQIELMSRIGATARMPTVVFTVAFTLATVAYMLAIRKHFIPGGAHPSR